MPLLEFNHNETALVLIKRESLGQKFKQKILERLSSISSTMRVHIHSHDENNTTPIIIDNHTLHSAPDMFSSAATAASHPHSSHDGGDMVLDRLHELHGLAPSFSDWPQWQPIHSSTDGSRVSVRRSVTVDEECFAQGGVHLRKGRSMDIAQGIAQAIALEQEGEVLRGEGFEVVLLCIGWSSTCGIPAAYSQGGNLLRSASAPARDLPMPASAFMSKVCCVLQMCVMCAEMLRMLRLICTQPPNAGKKMDAYAPQEIIICNHH